MLKLMVPLSFEVGTSLSEALYSTVERGPTLRHQERTNQRWVAVRGRQSGKPVFLAALNTGSFGHSLTHEELALNLLRSPAYSSFCLNPDDERHNDRFLPRQDQGEHELRFALMVGGRFSEAQVSRAAQVFNVPPLWQVYYPQPEKVDRRRRQEVAGTVSVDDPQVQVVALKKTEKGNELIVRLYNPSAQERQVGVKIKPFAQAIRTKIGKYGLVTLAVGKGGKKLRWRRVNLVEKRERQT
jgi:alpha-mannosidase